MAVFRPTVGGAANKCPLRPTLSNCELGIAALVLILVFSVIRVKVRHPMIQTTGYRLAAEVNRQHWECVCI